MHLIQQKDPIDVIAVFKGNHAVPHKFKWAGKDFVVETINLSYSKRTGDGKLVYYAVIAEGNYFKLVFNTNDMEWFVEEVYAD